MRAVAVALLVAGMQTIPAGAGASTAVTRLDVALVGSRVEVQGQATFVDRPLRIARDDAGDATLPGLGADLTAATISRPGSGTTLRFTLAVADLPPAGAVPGLVTYFWPVSVDRAGRVAGFTLLASRPVAREPGGAAPHHAVASCETTPPWSCSEVRAVSGSIGATSVTWDVPAAAIGATPGSWIRPGTAPIRVGLGIDGSYDPPGPPLDSMAGGLAYRVGPWGAAGIGRAGTPAGAVRLSTAVGVSGTGALRASLPAPKQAGRYVVVAQVCGGLGDCATRTSRAFTLAERLPPHGSFDMVLRRATVKRVRCPANVPSASTCLDTSGYGSSSRLGPVRFGRMIVSGFGPPQTIGALLLAGQQVKFAGYASAYRDGQFVYTCFFTGGTGPYARARGSFTITAPTTRTERWVGELRLR